jgi:DNA-binding LacI/PurR family transcriptional regulator
MLEQGHRRIAFFSAHRSGLSAQYEQGLRKALQTAGVQLPDKFIRIGTAAKVTVEHEQFVKSSLEQLLKLARRPTALFCSFDSEAELVYLLLGRMGVKVPEEISIVGFGGTWREGAIARRLTSITVDEEELGLRAAKLLDEMRRRERPLNDVTEILMPLSISKGETLGPAAA